MLVRKLVPVKIEVLGGFILPVKGDCPQTDHLGPCFGFTRNNVCTPFPFHNTSLRRQYVAAQEHNSVIIYAVAAAIPGAMHLSLVDNQSDDCISN